MTVATDHTGKRFGRLTAIERVGSQIRYGRQKAATWLCRCDCGNERVFMAQRLVEYQVKSCGCLSRKLTPEQRQELVEVYRAGGYAAAKPLAIQFGVAPRYIARLARAKGVKNNYCRGVVSRVKKHKFTDLRWRWAIERGGVIA